jgi:predicted transposase/invertase (TIGR01784 family)
MKIGIYPTVDFAFKRIFGSPENAVALIGLLNAILRLQSRITAVTLENPFNYQDFPTDKVSILDVRATDESGNIYNIEMQLSVNNTLLKRMAYYGAVLFSRQLKEGDKYDQLKPVFSIVLVDGVIIKNSDEIHHNFMFIDRKTGIGLENIIQLHTLEFNKYN